MWLGSPPQASFGRGLGTERGPAGPIPAPHPRPSPQGTLPPRRLGTDPCLASSPLHPRVRQASLHGLTNNVARRNPRTAEAASLRYRNRDESERNESNVAVTPASVANGNTPQYRTARADSTKGGRSPNQTDAVQMPTATAATISRMLRARLSISTPA